MKKIINLIILLTITLFLVGCQLGFSGQPSPQPSPVSEEVSWQVKIIDGNVCRVDSSGETKILVDKKGFEGVDSFSDPQVSPDKTKICFLAHTMVPIWLYYTNIDGSQVAKIDVAKNCSWSHDSQKIAYNNHTTDVSPVDVLVYDISLKKITNLTSHLSSESAIRAYELPQWSADDSKITSNFGGLDFENPSNKIQGTSVIDLSTGKVTDN